MVFVVHQNEGVAGISDNLVCAFKINCLVDLAARITNAHYFCADFDNIIEETGSSIVDIAVYKCECQIKLREKFNGIEIFKKYPARFFKKASIAIVVEVAMLV